MSYRKYYCQEFSARNTVIPLWRAKRLAKISYYSLLSVHFLRQNCPGSFVTSIRIQDVGFRRIRIGKYGSLSQKLFQCLKSVLLVLFPLEARILTGEYVEGSGYRGKIRTKSTVIAYES